MVQEKVHLDQEISFLESMVTRFRHVCMRKVIDSYLISVVCFRLGNSPAPTFRTQRKFEIKHNSSFLFVRMNLSDLHLGVCFFPVKYHVLDFC